MTEKRGRPGGEQRVAKSDQEWRKELSPEQYAVCRQKGTERPFTGEYYDCKRPGIYRCSCCGNELFRSEAKYESGTGWPSFFEPIDPESVATRDDRSTGSLRTEVICARCDAHLGHVFPDGPPITGKRYCMNSVALALDEADEPE
jgi:peptide-methionine (R)-S-oxide reductase